MPQQENIPVYMFVGFLEGGKTHFIKETLEDGRFINGDKTLLLVCEEGVEEYDTTNFAEHNVFMHVLEDKSELNEENLAAILKKYDCVRAVVEYNGMWNVTDFFNAMPEDWAVYQIMFFADASTFLQYDQNMRSLVVDKLNVCELVVFNRFDPSYDKMKFHQIVRGVSRRTDIAYEFTDGTVAYDDIEDPLPFDVEAKEITVKDRDFALWYRDAMEEPKKYDGKIMSFRVMAACGPNFPKNTFAVGRKIMTCCVEDIQYCWLVADAPKGRPELSSPKWFNVKGKIKVQKNKMYRGAGPVLTVTDISPADPPEQEVATFY
ncbi:MAG: GTPase [Ruminococcus sp.]|nr:GTPase [Ruminococcus sp.]